MVLLKIIEVGDAVTLLSLVVSSFFVAEFWRILNRLKLPRRKGFSKVEVNIISSSVVMLIMTNVLNS
jgi:hypothetical protein